MFAAMEFSRCTRTASARRPQQSCGLSKLNSVIDEVDMNLGEFEVRTAEAIKRFERLRE
jgi:hypothetical protein